jgi:hypothetical protein
MRKKPVCSNNGWMDGTCNVCGAKGPVAVCSSIFGASSYAYCQDCFDMSKEPYQAIVDYISAAGHWPQDINEGYQYEVRRQLKMHNKTEEEFQADVEYAIAEEQHFFINYHSGKVEF